MVSFDVRCQSGISWYIPACRGIILFMIASIVSIIIHPSQYTNYPTRDLHTDTKTLGLAGNSSKFVSGGFFESPSGKCLQQMHVLGFMSCSFNSKVASRMALLWASLGIR